MKRHGGGGEKGRETSQKLKMRGTSGYNKFKGVRVHVAMVTNPGLEGGFVGRIQCPMSSLSLNFNGNSDQMKDVASKRMEMEVR